MRLPVAAVAVAAAIFAAPASAAPVLEVRPDSTVVRDDPYLPPRAETDLPRPAGRVHAGAAPAARAAAGPTVGKVLADALEAGQITADQRREWRRAYRRALRTRRDLSGPRKTQLKAVIEILEGIARAGQLDASRMPALFLQLERNTEYWPDRPYPASGQRVSFADSELIFQYYPGDGLQIQPLANFGRANGLWRAGREERLRTLLDELVAIASRRGRFTTWEYWFEFGGGGPPWMSAMAQGTAIQALSRASELLGEPSYLRVARRGIRAFSTRAPLGVRVRGRDGGNHYLIHSFSRGLRVLNAFTQTLNGLYDYATIAEHERAMKLFEKGELSLRAELPDYDTGAWTLYSLGGREATLEYHQLAAEFLANLCEKLGPGLYCDTAERFDGYVTESPRLELRTSRLVEDNLQYVRFTVSKQSTVQLTISRNGSVVYSASASVPYGTHAFSWTPSRPGDYVATLSAESFNGTHGSTSDTIAVREKS
jgi:D-glucuronyl C5-epimerase-like protein